MIFSISKLLYIHMKLDIAKSKDRVVDYISDDH